MGANRRLLYAVAGAAAIVLGSAGAGYGVYDAWQQEQAQSDTSSSDPRQDEADSGGSSTLRSSPSTDDRTTTPSPEPTGSTPDRDRSDTGKPDDSRSSDPDEDEPKRDRTDRSEGDEDSKSDPTPERDQEESDPPEPSPDATAASSREAQLAAEVIELTNVERKAEGCDPLRSDSALSKAARGHSVDMAERDYFDHNSPDGTTPWKRMLNAGYEQPAAENIAKGQADAASVVAAWMDSSGHRENILNCSYEAIGVGVELDEGPYWTQNFGFE